MYIDNTGIYYFKCKNGVFMVNLSSDEYYPGLDIEYISDDSNSEYVSNPRILFELQNESCDGIRALLWADKNSEDYSHEILFS